MANNRYSYSRMALFNQDPKLHSYVYEEGIKAPGGEHLILGRLFHEAIDKYYRQEDYQSVLDEYERLVRSNELSTESGMLEEVFTRYIEYYAERDDQENIIMNETKIEEEWDDGDIFSGIVDRLVERDGLIILRDTKTTSKALSYIPSDVKYSAQLLTYVALVQNNMDLLVDAYEIDEVRLAKIQPVPLNLNGKPSAARQNLGLVLYEDYYNKLAEMGLEEAPEYQGALDYLEKRGHPLFKRTTAHVVSQDVVYANLDDLRQTYEAMKVGSTRRIRTKLINYSPYKELYDLDYHDPDPLSRQIIIDKITKGT